MMRSYLRCVPRIGYIDDDLIKQVTRGLAGSTTYSCERGRS